MTKRDLALSYLARGFSVIPLWPKSKQAIHQWTEYQKRLPSVAEVERWWDEEPDANIGIITGAVSGIIVGDVDPRHGGSVADMQRDAPSSFVVTTPGGGAHFYYRHPGGRVTKGKPRPGIDRQSDGCYVVAAGSYVVTDAYEGEYHALSEGEFADAPAWLLGEPETIEGPAPNRTEAWIGAVLRNGCPPGTRNDTLAQLAGYFAGKGVPQDISEPFLVRWVLSQEGTGVTPAEASRTIGSIYAKETRKQRAASKGDGTYVVDEFVQDDPDKPLETMTLADFGAAFYDDRIQWLIPEWLPERSIAFLVSPPGRFKTMLTFDAAISVAGGWPFMGQFAVQNPGPVLVIQQEDDYGDMARRFNRIFAARQPGRKAPEAPDEDTIVEHLAVCDIPPVHICTTRGFNLDHANLRRLEDLIRRIRPRVVIIDPLYSITSAEDFMMHAARDMMPLKRLRDVYNVGFLIAAHTKKGAEQGREGLWGSQFLNAFLETGWQIRDREDGDDNQIALKRHFKSSGIPPVVNLEFQLDDNDGYRITVTDAEDDEESQDVVLKELRKLGEATAQEVADQAGLNVRLVQKRLKKFQEAGTVVSKKGDKNAVKWSIPKDTTKDL